MKNFFLLFVAFCLLHPLQAQVNFGLVAHYAFNNNDDTIVIDETGNLANNGIATTTTYECGVEGRALRFDGNDDFVLFNSTVVREIFGTEDFSLSFYFKSLNSSQVGTQTILTKRDPCSNNFAFAVRYTPNSQSINVLLSEDVTLNANFIEQVDPNRCWHHVAIVRDVNDIFLYLDGQLASSKSFQERIDISSDDLPLLAGESSCPVSDAKFEGLLDELRLYNRALTRQEVQALFFRPDEIGNGFVDLGVLKDTILYLGNTVETFVTNTCASSFQWLPDTGVQNPDTSHTVLEPTTTTTYTLEFTDVYGCTAQDFFRITVIDPDSLVCQAFLPNAFTPNNDGLNETFGIDNPFALTDFVSIEIYDRWGSLLFQSTDPTQRWDGSFKGTLLNPGTFMYRVRYRCDGVEIGDAGSFIMIR